MTLTDRLATAFSAGFGRQPDGFVRAPGRVNLIGEHTDYNGGFVLPCAIGVETQIAWARRTDHSAHVIACDFAHERDDVDLAEPVRHHPDGGWRDYVRSMIAIMQADGMDLRGIDMAIGGDIPRGAGLSSSASLEVAVCHAMLAADQRTLPATRIARLAQHAENDFVGMNCGIMDQMSSAGGEAGAALLIDCLNLSIEPVPLPPDTAIMIVHSGVRRGLVEGHYNQRRAECETAAAAMGVSLLREADLGLLAETPMADTPRARARHIINENGRVLAARDALRTGDLTTMGRLMVESHASMRDDFCITVPKVDELADICNEAIATYADGRGGARMTGGGFGGAVVALMPAECITAVDERVRSTYKTPAGKAPLVMIERAVGGAGPL